MHTHPLIAIFSFFSAILFGAGYSLGPAIASLFVALSFSQSFPGYLLFPVRSSTISACLASYALRPCTFVVAVVSRCRGSVFSKNFCSEPTSHSCSSLQVAALRIGPIYVCYLRNTNCCVPLKFVGHSYDVFFQSLACNPGCNTVVCDSRCTESFSKLWTPQGDKWSPMTPKRRPIGPPR